MAFSCQWQWLKDVQQRQIYKYFTDTCTRVCLLLIIIFDVIGFQRKDKKAKTSAVDSASFRSAKYMHSDDAKVWGGRGGDQVGRRVETGTNRRATRHTACIYLCTFHLFHLLHRNCISHEKLVFQSNAHARAGRVLRNRMQAFDNGAHKDYCCAYTLLQNKTKRNTRGLFCGNTGFFAEVQDSLVRVSWLTNWCTAHLKLVLMMLSEFWRWQYDACVRGLSLGVDTLSQQGERPRMHSVATQ